MTAISINNTLVTAVLIIAAIKLTVENQNSITMFVHLLNRLNLVGVNQAKLKKCVKIN